MRRLLALLAALIAVSAATAGGADASTGHCLPDGTGPICHFWGARVTAVSDGDTIKVDLDGDRGHRVYPVRVTDIQAMEQSVYSFHHPDRRRGECYALEATARLEQLIRAAHWRVRLAAQNVNTHAGHRLRRSIAVKRGGRWHDLGETLMAEGHTLWMAGSDEYAWNVRYNLAEQRAEQKGIGMWDPTHCGVGPAQDVPLRLWVSWDPVGSDVAHLNGEWIKVQNRSATASISLARWWVRDAMLRRFTIPAGTELRPGETATVYAGHGTRAGNSFFWGLDSPPFQNPGDYRHLGDGGYLFDPQGDLRASMVYPCVVACSSPDQGAIRVTVQPRRTEYALFRNVSTRPVDLYGYEMTTPGSSYDFGPHSLLQPGQAIQVDVQGDPADDTQFERHWGLPGREFPDGGGSVSLKTFTDITLGCASWGSGSC